MRVNQERLVEEFSRQVASHRAVEVLIGVVVGSGKGPPRTLPFMEIIRSLVSSDMTSAPAMLGHIVPELVEDSDPPPRLPDDPDGSEGHPL